jgi:hypothetical protein
MNTLLIPLTIAAALVAACADGTLPPKGANDPANPNAPETPSDADAAPPAPPAGDALDGGQRHPAGHEHHHPASPASSGGSP